MSDYVISGPKWNQATVYWYISPSSAYFGEFAEAFARWDSQIDLDFAVASSAATADIVLQFDAIDGPYNTLGVARTSWFVGPPDYYNHATITFDTGENWNWSPSAGSFVLSDGTTFYEVALHEIGHSIGLDHPTNSAVLMYHMANGSATDLTASDIFAARLIYGAEATSAPDLDIYYTPTLSAASVTQGGSVQFSYYVTNWGGDAGISSSGIYLSSDSTITTSDTRLTTDQVAAITGGGNSSPQHTVTLGTFGLATGTYYLGVIADYANAVTESDETNNASAGIAFTIAPAHQATYRGSWTGAGNFDNPWFVGDFNGDTRDDLMRWHGSVGEQVLLSSGSSFGGATTWTGAGNYGNDWIVGDFNGDNRDDLMRWHGSVGEQVLLSSGSSFGAATTWTGAGNFGNDWIIGDFNGDNRDDLMRWHGTVGQQVMLSNGSSFGAATTWTAAGNYGNDWVVGDFNGDGKDDLLRWHSTVGAQVLLSNGSSFGAATLWTTAQNLGHDWIVGDLDGDGKDDLMRWHDSVGVQALFSNGSGFSGASSLTGAGNFGNPWITGDFDGSGTADLMRWHGSVGEQVFTTT